MKFKNKSKGFSLIETIATIFIIAIILTIAVTTFINTITKSKSETNKIAKNNILNSARIYAKEQNETLSWNTPQSGKDSYKFSCISINELINKDLLKKDIKDKYNADYVIIKKDENNNIISEEIDKNDENGICQKFIKTIPIPTPKDYCNDLTYNKESQILTKVTPNEYSFNDNEKTNAGTYTITATLNEPNTNHYQWTDGTTENKKFSCTIKKDTPIIKLDSNGIDMNNISIGDEIEIQVQSEKTNGTIILKSSNNDYYEVTMNDTKIKEDDPNHFNIKVLSTRNTKGTITVTLIPDDKTNYNNSSTTLTIGDITKKEIEKPKCISNIFYDGEEQKLVNSNDGIKFSRYKAKDIGRYQITAELNFGYVWKGGTVEDIPLICEIKAPIFKICYDAHGGAGTMECDDVTYGNDYKIKENKFSYVGYKFTHWNTKADDTGTTYTDGETIRNLKYNNDDVITLYAQWESDTYTYNIKYELNGGRWNYFNYQVVSNDKIIEIPNPTKNIYTVTYDDNSTGATIAKQKDEFTNSFQGWNISNKNDNAKCGNSKNNLTNSCPDATHFKFFKNLGLKDQTVTLSAYWNTETKSLPQITKTSYTCNWNTKADGTGTSYTLGDNYMPTSNETLYAICNAKIVKIKYSPNGGRVEPILNNNTWSVINDFIYKNNDLLTTEINYGDNLGTNGLIDFYSGNLQITKTGYSTPGGIYSTGEKWICLSGCTITNKTFDQITQYNANDFCDASNSNCTVVLGVNWQANNYKVTFNPNGGSVSPNNKSVTYNSTYGTLPIPTKTGYSFNGWYTSTSGGNKITQNTKVTTPSAHTLYAMWTPNKIKVKFHTNGGTIKGTNTTYKSNSNGIVLVNGNEIAQTYNYGAAIDLLNYNNSGYLYITKNNDNINYYANTDEEWNTKADGSGTSFSQFGNKHNANELCNADSSDCTVTLYVNWKYSSTIIDGNRYYCTNTYDNSYRLSIFDNITCSGNNCNYTKINGLTNSNINTCNNTNLSNNDRGYCNMVFTPTWVIEKEKLKETISSNCITTKYVKTTSGIGINCRSGASTKTDRITGFNECARITVSKTTTKFDSENNWFYFEPAECYLSGKYLYSNQQCSSGSNNNQSTSNNPLYCGRCSNDNDCGYGMTCSQTACGSGYNCCVITRHNAEFAMCN